VEIDYLTGLHVRLDAKIRDLHTKDSYAFRKRLMPLTVHQLRQLPTIELI